MAGVLYSICATFTLFHASVLAMSERNTHKLGKYKEG